MGCFTDIYIEELQAFFVHPGIAGIIKLTKKIMEMSSAIDVMKYVL